MYHVHRVLKQTRGFPTSICHAVYHSLEVCNSLNTIVMISFVVICKLCNYFRLLLSVFEQIFHLSDQTCNTQDFCIWFSVHVLINTFYVQYITC